MQKFLPGALFCNNLNVCKGTPWQTFQIFDSIGGFPAISAHLGPKLLDISRKLVAQISLGLKGKV